MGNSGLHAAKAIKNDEYYTKYEDVRDELIRYKDQLRGKIIYCNCDSHESQFVKFLHEVRDEWGIKLIWNTSLVDGVSYDDPRAIELLKMCDIVITNPPFSKAREEFFPLLFKYNKKFLIIAPLTLAGYKNIFPYIQKGKMWTGYTHPKEFLQPDGTYKKFGNILWYTNLNVEKEYSFVSGVKYADRCYDRYDNHSAINVNKLADIPCDYDGIIGVPITIVHYLSGKRSPEGISIKVIGHDKGEDGKNLRVNGRECYARYLIKIERKML